MKLLNRSGPMLVFCTLLSLSITMPIALAGCGANMTPEAQAATLAAITQAVNAGIDSWIRLETAQAELEAANEPTPEELQLQMLAQQQQIQMWIDLLNALGQVDLANSYAEKVAPLTQEAGPTHPAPDAQSMLQNLPGAKYDEVLQRWDVSAVPMKRLANSVETACLVRHVPRE